MPVDRLEMRTVAEDCSSVFLRAFGRLAAGGRARDLSRRELTLDTARRRAARDRLGALDDCAGAFVSPAN